MSNYGYNGNADFGEAALAARDLEDEFAMLDAAREGKTTFEDDYEEEIAFVRNNADLI
jgi:hypothetical protein